MKALKFSVLNRGYLGIMEEQFVPLANRSVGGIITQGGTMLKTARFLSFKMKMFSVKLTIF